MQSPSRFIGLLLLVFLLVPGSATHPEPPKKEETPPPSESTLRLLHTMVEETNKERKNHNRPPLAMHDGLVKASVAHARDMAKHGYFGHHTPSAPAGVDDYEDYARAQDYEGRTGENLYRGEPRATQILKDWMATEDHRSNILSADYQEVGVGFARGQNLNGSYCVQFLGVRDDCYPVVINSEAYSTTDPTVHLYIYGKDRMKKMRFSSDGTTFTDWEAFSSTKEWKLTGDAGKKTVFVEVSNGETTYKCSDTIVLAPPPTSEP